MHWEIHPTERPNIPQNPWFWVLEKEVYPQLNHIKSAADVLLDLRSLDEEQIEAMFEVGSSVIVTKLAHTCLPSRMSSTSIMGMYSYV